MAVPPTEAAAPSYVTIAETQELLRCSRSTVNRMLTSGELTRHRVGTRSLVLIDRNEVQALVRTAGAA